MKKLVLIVPAFALAIGCGVSANKPLADIDAGLWAKICDKATADSVEETVECNGVEITIPAITSQQCQDANASAYGEGCEATFGDWKDCREWSSDADPCDPGDRPASCVAVATCAMASM